MKPRTTRPRKSSNAAYRPQLQRRNHTRRIVIFVAGLVIFAILLSISSRSSLRKAGTFKNIDSLRENPKQEAVWKDDGAWSSDPFSWAVPGSEGAVLLPEVKRPKIYTYYDAASSSDAAVQAAEEALIQIWQQAWWAQGFKPIVLSKEDAQRHSLYATLKSSLPFYEDALRWLAWADAADGILANWLCMPMSMPNDQDLLHFRHASPTGVRAFEGMASALFQGKGQAITDIVEKALKSAKADTARSIKDAVDVSLFEQVVAPPKSLVLYDADTNAENFKSLATKMINDKAAGLRDLGNLITAHLHQTFLEVYSDGFAVLSPFDENSHAITAFARAVADALRTCPDSPVPKSCPPNIPKCRICPPGSKRPVQYPAQFANSSTLFSIGTLLHPLTLTSLLAKSPDLSLRHVRRESVRDQWLSKVTRESLGTALGRAARIRGMKNVVAANIDRSSLSLWFVCEELPLAKDIERYFGFALPTLNVSQDLRTMLELDLAANRTLPTTQRSQADPAQQRQRKKAINEMQLQVDLAEHSGELVTRAVPEHEHLRIREIVEAWSMADTEVWNFVRSFSARSGAARQD